MIKYNNSNINDWNFGSDNIAKAYYNGDVVYQKIESGGTPPTPSFQVKWKATYSDSSTTSAECDSSSAITNGEINKTNLVEVEIGDCVTSIGDSALFRCGSLSNITIPNSVTSIGDGAFEVCIGLTSITIPDSVTSIGLGTFSSCSGLTSIDIPSGVTSIGNGAFRGCSSLTSMTVDSNNTVYDSRNNCNGIIQTSTNELLFGCQNTTIPDSVTSIGSYAFYYCTGLTSCTIGSGVTSIGSYAFAYCSRLTNIVIPNGVTSIGQNVFAYCSGLTSINIPDNVTSIGYGAFMNCSGLTSITVEAATPPTLANANAFNNTNNCPIYVPSGSVDTYKAASRWSTYASRIQAIPNS